jgi:hypothetical protein
MIDFLNHGAVKTFVAGDKQVSSMEDSFETVVQFIPVGGNHNEVRSNLNAMLSILDEGLADMQATDDTFMSRSVLIQSDKRFPTPCVILWRD